MENELNVVQHDLPERSMLLASPASVAANRIVRKLVRHWQIKSTLTVGNTDANIHHYILTVVDLLIEGKQGTQHHCIDSQ